MQAHIGEVNGTISIGCSSLIGQTLLPEVLSLYNSQFPNVEIQVQVGSTEQIKANHRDYHVMITRGNKVMNLTNTHPLTMIIILSTQKKERARFLNYLS